MWEPPHTQNGGMNSSNDYHHTCFPPFWNKALFHLSLVLQILWSQPVDWWAPWLHAAWFPLEIIYTAPIFSCFSKGRLELCIIIGISSLFLQWLFWLYLRPSISSQPSQLFKNCLVVYSKGTNELKCLTRFSKMKRAAPLSHESAQPIFRPSFQHAWSEQKSTFQTKCVSSFLSHYSIQFSVFASS